MQREREDGVSRRTSAAPMPALDQLPLRQVLHQRAEAEGPGLALVAGPHAVDELAELRGGDRDDVIALVGEPLPRRIAIPDRSEHGTEEEHKAIGVLMPGPDRLLNQIGRIATDLADRGMAVEDKAVGPPHVQADIELARVLEREA